MIYPTISELTKDKFNRYQLAIATAKCARLITEEYVKQRTAAESALTGSKESGARCTFQYECRRTGNAERNDNVYIQNNKIEQLA